MTYHLCEVSVFNRRATKYLGKQLFFFVVLQKARTLLFRQVFKFIDARTATKHRFFTTNFVLVYIKLLLHYWNGRLIYRRESEYQIPFQQDVILQFAISQQPQVMGSKGVIMRMIGSSTVLTHLSRSHFFTDIIPLSLGSLRSRLRHNTRNAAEISVIQNMQAFVILGSHELR